MSEIIEELKRYLEAHGCGFHLSEESAWVAFGFDAANGRWRTVAGEDDHGRLVVLSFLPLNVPVDRRMAVAELITRINFGLGLGQFLLDLEDGDLRFMVTDPLCGGALAPEMIEEAMGAHELLVDAFLPAIGQVLFSNTPPKLALQTGHSIPATDASARFSLN